LVENLLEGKDSDNPQNKYPEDSPVLTDLLVLDQRSDKQMEIK
jgi:hypothetical protein